MNSTIRNADVRRGGRMEYRTYQARTVDEAITQACLALGVTSDRLEYDVTQEPTNGFLGIGSKPAVIRARVRSEQELQKEKTAIERAEEADQKAGVRKAAASVEEEHNPSSEKERQAVVTSDEIEKRAAAAAARAKAEGTEESVPVRRERRENERGGRRDSRGRRPDRERRDQTAKREVRRRGEETPVLPHEPSKPKPERVVKPRSEEEAAELTKTAEDFLHSVFDAMHIKAELHVEYDQTEGAVNCMFSGEEMGILIGKRGQTLDSLQYLTSLVVNRRTDDYVRVKLDTEDYRNRRAETLNNLARNIAYKVKRTHEAVALEPMNPYERRIIHSALQGNRFVETYSEGEEPYRHVVVAPKRHE